MKKTVIIGIVLAVMLAESSTAYAGITWKTVKTDKGYVTKFYDNGKYKCRVRTTKKLKVRIIKSEKLNYEKLYGRYNKFILVEKVRGKCINRNGDGKTSDGYYISYKGVRGHRKGRKYTTYCIYANNQAEDDIIARVDYRRR